ncbi:MAG: hypothetical protein P4M02_01930 [Clostridia bacterium]|nr:hypothetical protein [Clostridia bacterium]
MLTENYAGTSNHAQQMPWWLSWAFIVIMILIFWPVGIYLLWKRTTVNKQTAMSAGKTISIVGWVLLALGIVAVIAGTDDPSQAVTGRIEYLVIFVCSGLVMILLGERSKRQAKCYKKYLAMVVNQGITSIDTIAAAAPAPYEKAKSDLQKMIDKGYFAGAFIDETRREIALPKNAESQAGDFAGGPQPGAVMAAVTCKSCGANNRIARGTTGTCEYCGSPLSSN